MKKNVAGQKIGAQMVSATDGSAFTGAVTVYVTLDAGVQAVGSVGAGACTHEGNGYHTYAPAQAETNGDLAAFTFIGTGAVPGTVQIYTGFPQTGDVYDRLGAPAGASVSADVAAVKTQTAAIEVDTQDIQSRIPAALVAGRIDASIGAMAANVLTAAATAADFGAEVADAVWDEAIAGHLGVGSVGEKLNAAGSAGDPWTTALPGAYGAGSAGKIIGDNINATISSRSTMDAAGVRTAVGLASANLDTQLDAMPTAVENADALLARNVSGGSSAGRTVKQAFHFIRNKWVVAAGTLTVYDTDDTTSSWTAAVTGTAGADPVTGSDPA